jgi:hypothetical protein
MFVWFAWVNMYSLRWSLILTNYMDQGPSWDGDSFLIGQ